MGFDRPIVAGCIFCHSGRPNPVAGTNGQFENTPFSEMAIGCENCHGPGAAHVRAMHGTSIHGKKRASHSRDRESRPSYPLPGRQHLHGLPSDRRRAGPQAGKTYQDFRPGHPLDDTLSILMVPPTRESPPSADHVEHYYSMTLSKCYRAQPGRLRCITCHDPHVEPSREKHRRISPPNASPVIPTKAAKCPSRPECRENRPTTAQAAICQSATSRSSPTPAPQTTALWRGPMSRFRIHFPPNHRVTA